jgi:hypothetical protein
MGAAAEEEEAVTTAGLGHLSAGTLGGGNVPVKGSCRKSLAFMTLSWTTL